MLYLARVHVHSAYISLSPIDHSNSSHESMQKYLIKERYVLIFSDVTYARHLLF